MVILLIKIFRNIIRTWLTIKTRISKLKTMKHQGAKYPNENDSEDTETNRTFAVTYFNPKILLDDEIAEDINSLNSK